MAKPFDGFTKQQEKAIHQTIEPILKPDADWNRILSDITTVMVDLYEGASVPGAVAYPATEKQKLKVFDRSLNSAVQATKQLGKRLRWHIEGPLPPVRLGKFVRILNDLRLATERAAKTPNPHVHYQTNGKPKNHAIRLAVSALLDSFEKATGMEPIVYASEHSDDGYDGNFYQFAVACLVPVHLVPAKSLGSAILAEYKELKRVEKENRNPASKRAKSKKSRKSPPAA